MDKLGYSGSHLTIGAEDFIAACVAPLVAADAWDRALIDLASHGQLIVPVIVPADAPTTQPGLTSGKGQGARTKYQGPSSA